MKKIKILVLSLEFIFLLLIIILKNSIIIGTGIRFYTHLFYLLIGLLVITLIVFAIMLLKEKSQEKAQKEILVKEEEKSNISSKKTLRNSQLRTILKDNANGEWSILSSEINKCIKQMEDMDEEQERLHILLKTNDVDILSDTEDILERVEQCMCKNTRKIINYMSVYHNDTDDVNQMKDKLSICYRNNGNLLKEVHEFLLMLTEFLNSQDENYDDTMLLTYKETLISMTRKEEF